MLVQSSIIPSNCQVLFVSLCNKKTGILYAISNLKASEKIFEDLDHIHLLQIGFSHFEKINKTQYLNALYIYFYWYIWFYIAWHGCILYIQRLCPEISSPRAEAIYPWPWEDLVYVSYSIISNSTCIWLIPQPEHWQRKFW